MSWSGPIRRRTLAALLGLAFLLTGLWGAAGSALALGPFNHLVLARQLADPALFDQPTWRRALLAGALALDAGYYPGAEDSLAEAVHLLRPWDVCRALTELAATPEEKAFALGYVSHAILDGRGHAELINRLSGRPFSADQLNHKRVEWGLDCWVLTRPENQWLWEVEAHSPEGLGLWARALGRAYGVAVPEEVLDRSLRAELVEVDRLPRVFWYSGQTRRPGRWWGNAAGWILGHTARPLAVRLLSWHGGYINERAVLGARPPQPQDISDLQALLGRVEEETRAVLAGAALPQGNLDADPACHQEDCPGALQARAWLKGLR